MTTGPERDDYVVAFTDSELFDHDSHQCHYDTEKAGYYCIETDCPVYVKVIKNE